MNVLFTLLNELNTNQEDIKNYNDINEVDTNEIHYRNEENSLPTVNDDEKEYDSIINQPLETSDSTIKLPSTIDTENIEKIFRINVSIFK